MFHPPPFTPMPAEAHMRRWPRIILPTFEMAAVMRGQQPAAGALPNSPHLCDFEDGIRLVICVSQVQPSAPEELEVSISADTDCEMLGIETGSDHWKRVLVERLMEIDPSERPRAMSRCIETTAGVIIALFEWDRAREEHAALLSMRAKGLDPKPLHGGYLEMFTVYRHPADYPGSYIVRRTAIVGSDIHLAGAWQAPDLKAARAVIPPGKINIGRQPVDLSVIEEVWV